MELIQIASFNHLQPDVKKRKIHELIARYKAALKQTPWATIKDQSLINEFTTVASQRLTHGDFSKKESFMLVDRLINKVHKTISTLKANKDNPADSIFVVIEWVFWWHLTYSPGQIVDTLKQWTLETFSEDKKRWVKTVEIQAISNEDWRQVAIIKSIKDWTKSMFNAHYTTKDGNLMVDNWLGMTEGKITNETRLLIEKYMFCAGEAQEKSLTVSH